jgi:hypothetical protein
MTYSGTKGETPDTDKAAPSGLPRQLSTLPRGIASQPRRNVAPDHMEISDSDIKSALSILI